MCREFVVVLVDLFEDTSESWQVLGGSELIAAMKALEGTLYTQDFDGATYFDLKRYIGDQDCIIHVHEVE